jgi:hypothetical protein
MLEIQKLLTLFEEKKMVKGKAHLLLLYFHLSPFLRDNGSMEFLKSQQRARAVKH